MPQQFSSYTTHDIKRFIPQGTPEYKQWNQGEPDAVVFEATTGVIVTVFSDSPNFDQAWAFYDEWMAANGGSNA